MKYILLTIVLLACYGLRAQDTFKLNGIVISKKDFGITNRTELKGGEDLLKSTTPNNIEKRSIIFKSSDFENFAINEVCQAKDLSQISSIVKAYKKDGTLRWGKDFGTYHIVDGKLLNGEKGYVFTIVDMTEDIYSASNKIQVYDNEGKLLLEDENMYNNVLSKDQSIFYYSKFEDGNIEIKQNKTLECFDIKNNKKWSHQFSGDYYLPTVSSNGDYSMVQSGNDLYLFNRNGKIKKEYSINMYKRSPIDISNDGKYLLFNYAYNIPSVIKIFDLNTGKASQLNFKLPQDKNIVNNKGIVNGACFVSSNYSKNLIALAFVIDYYKGMVCVYKSNGELIGYNVYDNIQSLFMDLSVKEAQNGVFEVLVDDIEFAPLRYTNSLKLKKP